MRALFRIFRLMLRSQRRALIYGTLLALTVLVMGAALLGLSGWFITAAAVAGLAGVGMDFNVFGPSSMVRFLALGRTAARYGERLSTHDATLRVLASLRVRLLDRFAARDWSAMTRLRGAQALNRITADVDALDGIPLRLILPIATGLAAHGLAFAVLWWLADLQIAAAIVAIYLAGTTAVLAFAAARAYRLSARAEEAAQSFRTRLIDVFKARTDLMVYGRIAAESRSALAADAARRAGQARLDQIGRRAGAALSLVASSAAAAALYVGLKLAASGQVTPAIAAMSVFTALGLAETIAPMHRAATELGRMVLAATRMGDVLDAPPPAAAAATPAARPSAPVLAMTGVSLRRDGAAEAVFEARSLTLAAGETVALTGSSGSGKSTLLELAAGLAVPSAGQIELLGTALPDWPEDALRAAVTLVPQRAHLVAGTLRDNLALAAPTAGDDAYTGALDACQLTGTFAARGGLDAPLGPGGGGLSGGQARRVVLARALLRRPALLLLDEPTEGLDQATAQAVLAGIRAALPDAAIMIAAHRQVEKSVASRDFNMT